MRKAILEKLKNEVGATAIEYGLIVAAVGVALAAVILLLGDGIEETFQSILDTLVG